MSGNIFSSTSSPNWEVLSEWMIKFESSWLRCWCKIWPTWNGQLEVLWTVWARAAQQSSPWMKSVLNLMLLPELVRSFRFNYIFWDFLSTHKAVTRQSWPIAANEFWHNLQLRKAEMRQPSIKRSWTPTPEMSALNWQACCQTLLRSCRCSCNWLWIVLCQLHVAQSHRNLWVFSYRELLVYPVKGFFAAARFWNWEQCQHWTPTWKGTWPPHNRWNLLLATQCLNCFVWFV